MWSALRRKPIAGTLQHVRRSSNIFKSMMGWSNREKVDLPRFTGTESNLKQWPKPVIEPSPSDADEAASASSGNISLSPDAALRVTTLSNGVRVATVGDAAPIASVGLFTNLGSRFETQENNGITHLAERMLFKSTKSRTYAEVADYLEQIGSNIISASTRENVICSTDLVSTHIPHVVELFGQTISEPLFLEEEIDEQKQVMLFEQDELGRQYKQLLPELIHAAAYGPTTLGLPLIPEPEQIMRLSRPMLQKYLQQHMTGDRVVLAAIGVDHAHLVEMAKKHFIQVAPPPAVRFFPPSSAKFTGGLVTAPYEVQPGQPNVAHIAIGLKGPSWHDRHHLFATCALQALLGGGESFSSGGPGKGMYTRLFSNVMNRYGDVESAQSFLSSYEDSGVFGMTGGAPAEHLQGLFNVLLSELVGVVTGPVEREEFTRAKNMLKSSLMMALELRLTMLEDVGRQLLTFGKRELPSDICAEVDRLTVDDLKGAARTLLQSPVAIAVLGEAPKDQIPDPRNLEQILRSFV